MTTSLAQRVVAGLRAAILDGSLPPGAKVPSEAELIEQYGVSRTVVREAVTRLRAEGLVETFQGRGSFVVAVPAPTPFSVESSTIRTQGDVVAMIEFRAGVECEAAALAATRLTGAAAGQVRDALAAFSSADPADVVEADFAFHRAIAAATGNRFYLDLVDSLGPMMILLPRTSVGDAYSRADAAHVERVRHEHDDIAEAVLAGDPDTARAAMRLHLGHTLRRLT